MKKFLKMSCRWNWECQVVGMGRKTKTRMSMQKERIVLQCYVVGREGNGR